MDLFEYELVLKKVLDLMGNKEQISKAIEELTELSMELIKCHNNKAVLIKDIEGEIVDVFIMLKHLLIIFNIDEDELQARYNGKINRLKERLKEGYYNGIQK